MTFDATTEPPRSPARRIGLRRIVMGSRLNDFGRLPRYFASLILGSVLIWAPISGYLKTAPLSFKSHTSLILPGSGASASVNLNGIGQASSYANSAFASNAVSPTETYKRLLGADRILEAAARSLNLDRHRFGKPRVSLVDQTGLIHVEVTGGSPDEARQRGEALMTAFFTELDALRSDEQTTREGSGLAAIAEYRRSVAATRTEIEALQRESGLWSATDYDAMTDATRDLVSRVQDLAAQLSETTEEVAALEITLGIPAAAAAATLKLYADAEFISLTQELGIQAAALAEARSSFGEAHPKVRQARHAHQAAIASARMRAASVTGLRPDALSTLDLAPDGARAELLAQLVRQDAARAGVQRQYETMQARADAETSKLRRLAPQAARLEDLQRDFSVAEAVFASAIARSQSTKSDVYASYPLVQVLENPSLPEKPSSPNRKLAIAAGGAATFMLIVSLLLGWVRSALIGRIIAGREQVR
ncbi:GumC family protein [Actibacterium ureilyticum]|uniref:GumC family protein n=1 Tax=Actibacterium ureilyticum TaxID=1590614 RepID=UPI000BAB175E|nr:hypothetical protein [Actibacterium ureilyticum]